MQYIPEKIESNILKNGSIISKMLLIFEDIKSNSISFIEINLYYLRLFTLTSNFDLLLENKKSNYEMTLNSFLKLEKKALSSIVSDIKKENNGSVRYLYVIL